jgi:hypothetical protein
MQRMIYTIVTVTRKEIREKPDTLNEAHHLGTGHKGLDFLRKNDTRQPLQIPVSQCSKHFRPCANLLKDRGIFSLRITTRSYKVTEIRHQATGHTGIKVNHCKCFTLIRIHQYIIDFTVVMAYTDRQAFHQELPFNKQRLNVFYKPDDIVTGFSSSRPGILQRFEE